MILSMKTKKWRKVRSSTTLFHGVSLQVIEQTSGCKAPRAVSLSFAMSRSKVEKLKKKGSLAYVQKRINSISKRVDEFYTRLDGSSSITSPERKQHYNDCDTLKTEIELLSSEISSLPKAESSGSLQDFNEQKRKEQQKLEEIKSKLDRISEQLEPDEVEEDYFRKMQEGDVGASNSDLQTDKADDDDTHDARK